MDSLENNIKSCIEKEIEKGIIEKVIAQQLEQCIEKSIKDMFDWGGDIKKVVEKKIKSVMVPFLEEYDYSQYIIKLDSVLTDVLKATTLENKNILTNFKDLITEIPKEIKMSDILKEWVKHCRENIEESKIDMDSEGGYITVTLSSNKIGLFYSACEKYIITLECEEDEKLKYEFEIYRFPDINANFSTYSEEIYTLSSLRTLNEFEIFMLKVAQGHHNIILDIQDDVVDEFIEYE